MTELYIDKQLVVLPETFSITVIEENPFFTKNGKYTYDIALSLLDPINARIYNHLNRINRKGDIPKNRSAYLVIDNEVVINGTEAILEYSDTEVKIQLISGNSELNFLIGGDRKLRDLELGEAQLISGTDGHNTARLIYERLKLSYPQCDWQLIPYYAGIDDHFNHVCGNYFGWSYMPADESEPTPVYFPYYSGAFSGQVPQPYLCFIIKKIIETLGYTLFYNALAEDVLLRNLYIVHGMQTKEFAKMLPSWTVSELFSKIEQQFDCCFIVDEFTKTVRLFFNSDIDTVATGSFTELDAVDEFTVVHDEDNKLMVQNSNVAYNLDSDEYYDYMHLPADIMSEVTERNTFEHYDTFDELLSKINDAGDANRFEKIFTDGYDQFIAFKTEDIDQPVWVPSLPAVIPRKVNSFAPLYNSPDEKKDDIDLDFDIIPAAMVISLEGGQHGQFWYQYPAAGNYDPLKYELGSDFSEVAKFDIQDIVENGSENNKSEDYTKMRLAVYQGMSNLDPVDNTNRKKVRFPIAFVESLAEYFDRTGIVRWFGPIGSDIFRLANMNKRIYQKTTATDTTNIYKISFVNTAIGKRPITSMFLIKNKLFRCVKIERVVTHRGFEKIAKGEFYPYL